MKKIKIDQLQPDIFDDSGLADLGGVQKVVEEVKKNGDEALKRFSLEFDGVKIERFKVEKEEIKLASSLVPDDFVLHLEKVAENLRSFSKKQLEMYKDFEFEIQPGVFAGQRIIPIARAGIYVPGGRYPLLSSLLMGAVPAKVAGVEEIVVCSPPSSQGSLHPAILVAAQRSGVDEVYTIGGVQAIAAMALGTQSVKRVHKIVGPGNVYVNAAKKIVFGNVGIDFIAGPTELLIIADRDANPSFLASDLIAQAEHDAEARPMLVTDSEELAEAVLLEIPKQMEGLRSAPVAQESLERNGLILLVSCFEEAVEFANRRAPEHLALHLKNPEALFDKLRNYGSLFIGEYAAEVLGDYSSGLNHILPTNFGSRYCGGLGVRDFVKIQTTLRVSREGFFKINSEAMAMAKAEGLEGHANALKIRMKGKLE